MTIDEKTSVTIDFVVDGTHERGITAGIPKRPMVPKSRDPWTLPPVPSGDESRLSSPSTTRNPLTLIGAEEPKGNEIFFHLNGRDVSYRYPLPENPDRAIVVVACGKLIRILEYVGPGMSYLDQGGMLFDALEHDWSTPDGDGVWHFEGRLRSGKFDTPCGMEYEEWLDGVWSRVTEQDVAHLVEDETPWDLDRWLIDGWRDVIWPPG